MRCRWIAGGAMVLMALVTAPANVVSGAGRAAQDPPQPTFRTETNYVRVDVFPTRDGAPVADLVQNDFESSTTGCPRPSSSSSASSFAGRCRRTRGLSPTPPASRGRCSKARVDGMLTRYWYWGERDRLNAGDPQEERYLQCYPGPGPTAQCRDDDRGVDQEMIDRRREKRPMDALDDLVRFLRGVREERKAVLTISDGWLLYQRNPFLARGLYCRAPTGPGIGVDPRGGKLTIGTPKGVPGPADCDGDRMQLSEIDNEQQFRRILRDDADGGRWHVAQLVLAPLAPADYVIELTGGPGTSAREQKRMLLAFRIVP